MSAAQVNPVANANMMPNKLWEKVCFFVVVVVYLKGHSQLHKEPQAS